MSAILPPSLHAYPLQLCHQLLDCLLSKLPHVSLYCLQCRPKHKRRLLRKPRIHQHSKRLVFHQLLKHRVCLQVALAYKHHQPLYTLPLGHVDVVHRLISRPLQDRNHQQGAHVWTSRKVLSDFAGWHVLQHQDCLLSLALHLARLWSQVSPGLCLSPAFLCKHHAEGRLSVLALPQENHLLPCFGHLCGWGCCEGLVLNDDSSFLFLQ
mmetsp:Transcript_43463/g.85757  ORF Transcript_43463/g.85757 Transcript_43463/m.85757 type:complete len:209 (+) Transcript_43463:480-1106(+)